MARSSSNFRVMSCVVAVSLPFVIASCGGPLGTQLCGGNVSAQITSLLAATASLQTTTVSLEGQVLTACKNIAQDLTGTRPNPTGTLDAQVMAACTTANTALQGAVTNTPVVLAVSPPRCSINAMAQLDCEVGCQASASCSPGTVDVRCSPGDLSVVCSGMCSAGATCEATAQAPSVQCNGSCAGVCTGTCSGGTANAAGECSGTCVGTCTGNCTITPGAASINCGAMARCRGGCSTTGTAPQCEGELTPPTCTGDAQCQAGCEARGSFESTCEPASVAVNGGNPTLVSTLTTNLPTLLKLRAGLTTLAADAQTLAATAQSVGTTLAGIPACALVQANQLTTAASGALAAAASVQVSVSVSVMVTGTAGVGP